MYGRRSRVGAHVAITVAAVALLAACARGGDGGTSRLDGSVTPPPPRDSGGGPIEPCAERGYAGTCQTATDVGALSEMISEGQEGLLVPPRDPEALAAAMERVAMDEHARCAMGERSAALARSRFSLDRLRADLTSVYSAIAMDAS